MRSVNTTTLLVFLLWACSGETGPGSAVSDTAGGPSPATGGAAGSTDIGCGWWAEFNQCVGDELWSRAMSIDGCVESRLLEVCGSGCVDDPAGEVDAHCATSQGGAGGQTGAAGQTG